MAFDKSLQHILYYLIRIIDNSLHDYPLLDLR